MGWEAFVEVMRHSMRPASLFIWALFGVAACYALWPFSGVVVGLFVPYWLVKAWKAFRTDTDYMISRLPPLSTRDWRAARAKLKGGK